MNGKYLYETYSSGHSIQWKNYKGDPLPQWDELQQDRQAGAKDVQQNHTTESHDGPGRRWGAAEG